jgi:hypothetical protein
VPGPARIAALVLVAAVLTAAPGCGKQTDERARVRATVIDFKTAVERGDVSTICGRLVSRALLIKLSGVGLPCDVALGALKSVERPKLKLLRVRVRGKTAFARVRTNAVGQPPSEDTIRLVLEGKGWRIASLAGDLTGPPSPANPAPVPGQTGD